MNAFRSKKLRRRNSGSANRGRCRQRDLPMKPSKSTPTAPPDSTSPTEPTPNSPPSYDPNNPVSYDSVTAWELIQAIEDLLKEQEAESKK
jgi:hypothetical protein